MAVRADTRRWLIVAALFVVSYGVSVPLAAYGVFLPVLAEHFGWTRGAVSAALSLNLLVGGIAGFAVGTLADRHGPRVLLAATTALAGAGFALVAAVSALWQLYLLVGLVAGVGTSSFYVLGTATVTHWFEDRRGLALALVLIGFNLGYITGGPAAARVRTQTAPARPERPTASAAFLMRLMSTPSSLAPSHGISRGAPSAARSSARLAPCSASTSDSISPARRTNRCTSRRAISSRGVRAKSSRLLVTSRRRRISSWSWRRTRGEPPGLCCRMRSTLI